MVAVKRTLPVVSDHTPAAILADLAIVGECPGFVGNDPCGCDAFYVRFALARVRAWRKSLTMALPTGLRYAGPGGSVSLAKELVELAASEPGSPLNVGRLRRAEANLREWLKDDPAWQRDYNESRPKEAPKWWL